jgi:phosphatidylglycerol:prolipoprotein diacylglycerol transferase
MTTGAKALYDLQHDQFSARALFSLEHYLAGGLWGGVLVYLVLALPLALILALQKRAALDLIALSLPIPLFFTKVGCLLNGCCHGKTSAILWAITFPEGAATAPPGLPTHPTQAYELLVIVCVFVVFRVLDHERWRGTMLLWFLMVYGLGRAATELFRADLGDRAYTLGLVSLSQILCVGAACTSLAVLCLSRTRQESCQS